jgi:hypothetical protein
MTITINSEIPSDLPPRKPLLKRKPSGKFKMQDFQREDLTFLSELEASANWSEMGCASGEAKITVLSPSGKVRYPKLKDAYLGFKHLNIDKRKNWKSSNYKVLAYIDGRIRHLNLLDILDSGIKETWTIEVVCKFTTKSHSIRLTPDHLVLSENNEWVEVQSLSIGDKIRVQGRKGAKHDAQKRWYPTVQVEGKQTKIHRLIAGVSSPEQKVHHIDEDKTNFNPDNLLVTSLQEHSRIHARDQIGSYDAPPAEIVKIEKYGMEHVYDLVMDGPHHNFVANDIVIHNSMKTSTVEWLIQQKLRHIPNPRVLVITTKSGKGTYYESLPEVLPEYDVYTVSTRAFLPVVGNRPITGIDLELPTPLQMRPVVVVAHYQCFTNRACLPRIKQRVRLDDEGEPMYDEGTGKPIKENIMLPDGTYDMVVPRCAVLMASHWDMIVIDEAHRIKNKSSQWTVNIKKLAKKTQFKHIMTGTGFINNPAEVWSLLNCLFPDSYRSYWKFREHFCEEDYIAGQRKIVGIKPEVEMEFKELIRRIGVRRTMLECFPGIQEPIETVVPVGLNPTQRKMYLEIMNDLSTLDAKGEPLTSPNVLSMLNRLRQIAVATPEVIEDRFDPVTEKRMIKVKLTEPSSKLDAAMDIIEGLEWDAERKDQVVVFSNFRDPLALLEVRLKNHKIPYLRLQTEMNEQRRYELWHDIWPKKEHQVFLTTLALGSESINLTSAHRAIFLDQSWSPKDNAQAIGRIYRPGQTGVCQLIYVRAEGTVDYRVLEANETKMGWFQQIFGAMQTEDDDE